MINYVILCLIAFGMTNAGNYMARKNNTPELSFGAQTMCVLAGPVCIGGALMIYATYQKGNK